MRAALAVLIVFLLNCRTHTAFGLHSRRQQRHAQSQQAAGPRHAAVSISRPCPAGCELNGNCNRALGVCECPVGYTGPNCTQPLWPSCRLAPEPAWIEQKSELYCTSGWYPTSCACLEECAAFVCPNGTEASCERESFDLFASKCFVRTQPAGASNETSTSAQGYWDGGSEFPGGVEEGVKYYKGWLLGDAKQEITRKEIVDAGIIEDVDPVNPLVVMPLSSCPLKCSMHGGCVRRKDELLPWCVCHYGYTGEFCEQRAQRTELQNICWNNCQGRGTCRRGWCHCKDGWWGKDCSSSRVFAPHSARRPVHKLRVYVYDLPWTVAYQPAYYLGWRDHDQNYLAWKVFGQMFMNDTVVRTENPWEANMFWIPAMTYAYSENTGHTVPHSKRAVDYVRQHWPFFNRSQGLDHFLWLTGDRGACDWPAEEDPALANIIKVVHFGMHHVGPEPKGWEGQIKNKHWGCFNPMRDIAAAAFWQGQAETAQKTYLKQSFDVNHIPKGRLLFFSGGIRADNPGYSNGVRQQLWRMFGNGSNPQVLMHQGILLPGEYERMLNTSKFCLAPSGYGWGIRLNYYMASGCVPVIIQDDIYQPWEDQLPYSEFSVRLPKASIPDIVPLLSEISDEEYLNLRAGLAKHWRAFIWDRAVGGTAYEYMIQSLKDRMLRLQARHYHPVHARPRHESPAPAAIQPLQPAVTGSTDSGTRAVAVPTS